MCLGTCGHVLLVVSLSRLMLEEQRVVFLPEVNIGKMGGLEDLLDQRLDLFRQNSGHELPEPGQEQQLLKPWS